MALPYRLRLAFVVWCVLCCVNSASGAPCGESCQAQQRSALLELYRATRGENWSIPKAWGGSDELFSNTSLPTHCNWYKVVCCTLESRFGSASANSDPILPTRAATVSCDSPGGVSYLALQLSNLQGSLPATVFEPLHTLQGIDLAGNHLTGTLPATLADLTELKVLVLASNKFTGTLPPSVFNMSSLRLFNVENNRISGTIPSMGQLSELSSFIAAQNLLTGNLPIDWLSSHNLGIFAVQSNMLTGTIPKPTVAHALGHLVSGVAVQLMLRNNQLTGSLMPLAGGLPFSEIDVGLNKFTGNLDFLTPPEADMLSFHQFQLHTLRVDHNQLSGSLAQFPEAPLELIDLASNFLEGTLPNLSSNTLNTLRLGTNNFTGPLPDLRLPNLEALTLFQSGLQSSTPNQRGEYLPAYLMFDRSGSTQTPDVAGLNCPSVRADPGFFSPGSVLVTKRINVDARFFQYQDCKCQKDFKQVSLKNGFITCQRVPSSLIPFLGPLIAGLVLAVGAGIALYMWRFQKACLSTHVTSKRSPPGEGKEATLVLTDIEGSTELWEWDAAAMMDAISLHDRIIRSQLSQFSGYEVSTEGDAFLLVFHEPADALGWAMATQQALLTARWPARLDQHYRSCISTRNESGMRLGKRLSATGRILSQAPNLLRLARSPDSPQYIANVPAAAEQVAGFQSIGQVADVADILFRGLNVRMAIATGVTDRVKVNAASKRIDYHGELRSLVNAMVSTLYGGQIVMDEHTFQGVSGSDGGLVNTKPLDCTDLERQRREASAVQRPLGRATTALPSAFKAAAAVALPRACAPSAPSRQPEADLLAKADSTEPLAPLEELPSYVDIWQPKLSRKETAAQRVRQTLQAARSRFSGSSAASTLSPPVLLESSRLRRVASVFPKLDLQPTLKEQPLWRPGFLSRLLTSNASGSQNSKHASNLVLIDMGTHLLKGISGSQLLVQAAIPGLEDRTRWLPSLRSISLSPGYFDAPGALTCPLNASDNQLPPNSILPEVTLVFCGIEGIDDMKAVNSKAVDKILVVFRDKLQQLLVQSGGYECQEVEGDCMLAFADAERAVLFCLMMQDSMMQRTWSHDITSLALCGANVSASGDLIWFGPRVRMGLCKDVPMRIMPHATSGRADYFGAFVNRAARFCFAAAHGGQIVMPLSLAQQVVTTWTGSSGHSLEVGVQQQGGAPPVLQGHASASPDRQEDHIPAWSPGLTPCASQGSIRTGLHNATSGHESMLHAPASASTPTDNVTPSLSSGTVQQVQPSRHPLAEAPSSELAAEVCDGLPRRGSSSRRFSAPDAKTLALAELLQGDELGLLSSTPPTPPTARSRRMRTASMPVPVGRGLSDQAAAPLSARGSACLSARGSACLDGSMHFNEDSWPVDSREVEVHHCGVFQFKGLSDLQTLVQMNSRHLADRFFSQQLPSKKARCLSPGLGLQCVIALQS